MDEARQVLDRLERIETLKASGGDARALLAEVRGLLRDGERWVTAEGVGTERPRRALSTLDALLREEVVSKTEAA